MATVIEGIEVGGETNIENEVIGAIAGQAAKNIPGVARLGTRSFKHSLMERVTGRDSHARGVEVESGKKQAVLDLDLHVHYGHSIPHVSDTLREVVAMKVHELTGLISKEINVHVIGIEFDGKANDLE